MKTIEEGGLGIRIFQDFNDECMAKLAMEFLKEERPWCLMMRKRYFRNEKAITYYISSSIWRGIRLGLLTMALDIRWIIGRKSKQSFWNDY